MDASELISLELMREHIRADEEQVSDELLLIYADAALSYCMKVCDDARWESAEDVPPAVKAALLLYLGDFDSVRAAKTAQQTFDNPAAFNLLMLCRNWYGGDLPNVVY